MPGTIIENNIRDKILSIELNIEDWDDDSVRKCLCMLKIMPATQVDNKKEMVKEEFRTVVKE